MSTKFPPIIVKNHEFNFGRVSVIIPEMVITCTDEAQIEALRHPSDSDPEVGKGVVYDLKGDFPKMGVDGEFADLKGRHINVVVGSTRFHWALWHEVIIPTWGLSEEAYAARLWSKGLPEDSEIGECGEEMVEAMKRTLSLLKLLSSLEESLNTH